MLALREEKTTHNLAPVGIRQKFSWAMGPFGLWGEKQAILTLRYPPGGQGAEERHGIIEPCVPKGVRSPNFIYIFQRKIGASESQIYSTFSWKG